MLLRAGAKIDSPTGEGATALLLAVEKDFLDVVKLLIKEGADVNWVRRDSSSVHTCKFLSLSVRRNSPTPPPPLFSPPPSLSLSLSLHLSLCISLSASLSLSLYLSLPPSLSLAPSPSCARALALNLSHTRSLTRTHAQVHDLPHATRMNVPMTYR